MKNNINLSSIIYSLILILVDFLVLVFSLEIVIYLRTNILQDFLPEFIESSIYKYYWIIFITLIVFIFEKIYFIRYDFWSDTKRVLKGLFLSFIAVLSVIILSKMSEDYSRFFIVLFYLIAVFLIPMTKRYLKRILLENMNDQVLRSMIQISNNSRLTQEAAQVISNLSNEDIQKILRWLQFAKQNLDINVSNAKKRRY